MLARNCMKDMVQVDPGNYGSDRSFKLRGIADGSGERDRITPEFTE